MTKIYLPIFGPLKMIHRALLVKVPENVRIIKIIVVWLVKEIPNPYAIPYVKNK